MQDDTQLKGYNIETGAEVTDLSLNVAFPTHHGIATEVSECHIMTQRKRGMTPLLMH